MKEKKKISAAQIKATAKYEKNNYFKVLVRFKKADEERIRAAAGESINGFIVSAVLDKIERIQNEPGSIIRPLQDPPAEPEPEPKKPGAPGHGKLNAGNSMPQ